MMSGVNRLLHKGNAPIRPPATTPCLSCPYRQDAPSGVWDESEYEKLPPYDGETHEQPEGLFMCHQQNQRLCAGWAGCHDMDNNLAVRLAIARGTLSYAVMDSLFRYETSTPLWASGREAADHGMKEVAEPGPDAQVAIQKLVRKRGLREARRKEREGD